MKLLDGVLDRSPRRSLADHLERGGGRGLEAARGVAPVVLVDEVAASGLRGRGGGGFPTGTKWRTVSDEARATGPPRVVVNGAEGEPGTFKDRTLLRTNPYKVLEGALIAARAVGSREIVVALKGTFAREIGRVDRAIGEIDEVGLAEDVAISIALGPGEYLFGEETALLEVLDGRQPFPRVAPPYRGGLEDAVTADGPPTLVNNVETLANVPAIIDRGADHFRRLGSDQSPGTVLCTISGATRHHGVGEVELGTSLSDAITAVGGGFGAGRRPVAALSGVANPILPAERFDTPMTYEDFSAIGSGLGAAGFVAYDDQTDLVAVAQGVARFLAVESCGQCEPCKSDGLAIAERLEALTTGNGGAAEVAEIRRRTGTITDGARCYLATQQQRVVASLLDAFPETVRARAAASARPAMPVPTAPIADIRDGRAVLDDSQFAKQPDWTHDPTWRGAWPAEKLADVPVSPPTRSTRLPAADVSAQGASMSEDVGEGSDPFAVLDDLHAELDRALRDLPHHPCPQRSEALHRLTTALGVYHDVTDTVLHPIVQDRLPSESSRVADDALRLSDGDRRAAERLLAEVRDGEVGAVGDRPTAVDVGPQLDELSATVRREIELDREVLIPQLGTGLADPDLVELGHALEEARAAALDRRASAVG